MGRKPPGLILDRKDNNDGYFKENCRWVTPAESAFNRRIFRTNKTGITGVVFVREHWFAQGSAGKGRNIQLYWGKDLFEACCARRAWELLPAAPVASADDMLNELEAL